MARAARAIRASLLADRGRTCARRIQSRVHAGAREFRCLRDQKDYDDARAALNANEAPRAIKLVEDGLGKQKGCTGSAGGKLMTGGLYALRGAAYFQTDLLPNRSDKEIGRAAELIRDCRKDVAGTDRLPMCESLLATVERYRTQHFCADALAMTNRADNEIFTDASAAKRDAGRGAAVAGKCKNAFNYAYRGIALAQVGRAEVKLGEPAAAALRESQKLVTRCLRGFGSARGSLANECRSAQKDRRGPCAATGTLELTVLF